MQKGLVQIWQSATKNLLIDKDMKKKELAELAGISQYTVTKMNRGDNVNTDTLAKICKALNCTFDDIVEVLPDEE